jgi:DUF4097 and DUF4098 domain-containing protein YvlB
MPQPRIVRRIAHAVLTVLAAVSLSACDVVVNTMEGGKARAVDQWARTYTMPADSTMEVANTNGRVLVEGTDGTTFDVKAEIAVRAGTEEAAREILKQVEIREESASGRVRLEAKYPKGLGRAHVEVKFTLRVPRRATVNVETVNGGIELNALAGTVHAETTNGGVNGRNLAGGVTASTTNGGIDVAMDALSAGGVRLDTTNGGITLAVPGDAKGTISARVVNGGIDVGDLAVEKTDSSRRKLDGNLNGGGPAIKLETVNGGIHMRRS